MLDGEGDLHGMLRVVCWLSGLQVGPTRGSSGQSVRMRTQRGQVIWIKCVERRRALEGIGFADAAGPVTA